MAIDPSTSAAAIEPPAGGFDGADAQPNLDSSFDAPTAKPIIKKGPDASFDSPTSKPIIKDESSFDSPLAKPIYKMPEEAVLRSAPPEDDPLNPLGSGLRAFRKLLSPLIGKTEEEQRIAEAEKQGFAKQFPGLAGTLEHAGGSDVEKKGLTGAVFGLKTPFINLPTNDEPVREKSNAYFEALLAPKDESDPTSLKIAKALYTPIAHSLNAMSGPVGLGTMGLSAGAGAISRIRSGVELGSEVMGPTAVGGESAPLVNALEGSVAKIFASDMGRSLAESAPDLVTKMRDPNANFQDQLQASVEFSLNAAFVGVAAHSGFKPEALTGKTQAQKIDLLAEASGKTHEEVIKQVQTNFDELLGNVGKPESVLAQEKRRQELRASFDEVPDTVPEEKLPRDDSAWRYEIYDTRNDRGQRNVNVTRVPPGGGRGESRPLQAWLSEGHDIPEVPEGHPRGNFSVDEVAENTRTAAEAQKAQDEEQMQLALGKLPEELRTHPAFGLGAATAEEMAPTPTVTGIKNAIVDVDRVKRGLPPAMETARRSFGAVWDEAMRRIESNGDDGQETTDQLIARSLETPSPHNDVEVAMLTHRKIDLENQFDKVTARLAENIGSDVTKQADRLTKARLSDALLDLYNVTKGTGRETGRGLSARRLLVDQDYSLARLETEKRASVGGRELTPEETAEVGERQKKLVETQKEIQEHEEAKGSARGDKAADEAVGELKKTAAKEGPQEGFDLAKEKADTIAKLKTAAADDPPLADLRGLIQKLALQFVREGVKERGALVDAVHNVVKGIVPNIEHSETRDLISGYGDFKPLDPDAAKATLRDLKGQLQQIAKLEAMQKGKAPEKSGVERRTPSDVERGLIKNVNEMKRKGGFTVTDPAKQLKSALDGIKTRLTNQLKDLQQQIDTKTRIVKTNTKVVPDAEVIELTKQRDALKEQFDRIFQKPELTDAERVALAEKAADRQITELERQNRMQEVFRKGAKPSVTSEALDAKRARIEALKEEREYIRDLLQPNRQTDTRLQALKTSLKNRTADLMERNANKDYSKKPPTPKVEYDAEAEKLQAAHDKERLEWQRGLLKDQLENRTPLEKMKDNFVKFRRGFIFSSPGIIAKLTAAAFTRMTLTPVREGVVTGLSKVFPKLAERTRRERGFYAQAESKAITESVTKGMKDAWQTLLTGKSDLDLAYGKAADGRARIQDVMPQSWIDFFGNLHGALKAPVKRAEFARSFEQIARREIEAGNDMSEPAMQMRVSIEAYKEAEAAIFQQDNKVASAYSAAIARLQTPDAEGNVHPGGTILAGTMQVLNPVTKVPTNVIGEALQGIYGSVTGSFKLASAYRAGIESLPPKQADLIMRQISNGLIGNSLLLLGFFAYKSVGGFYDGKRKRDDLKPGEADVFGVRVPRLLLHSPAAEILNVGATVARVAEQKIHGQEKGLDEGALAAALGLIEEVPFLQTDIQVAKILDSRDRPAALSNLAKSVVVPGLVSTVAEQTDRDAKGIIPRKTTGAIQGIESGLPGLRENLPVDTRKANRR